jgi:periplasmic protein TonB
VTIEGIPETFGNKLPPVNDRILTTAFLAALLHGIIILGVSFRPTDPTAKSGADPMLEVVLVNERSVAADENRDARYLAQRNQAGSGNTNGDQHAMIPRSAQEPQAFDLAGKSEAEVSSAQRGEDQFIAGRGVSAKVVYYEKAAHGSVPRESVAALDAAPNPGLLPNQDDQELRLHGDPKRQLWVTADTRESAVAVYLDAWRRKVERIGTINFPNAARRQGLSGTPVIEVAIGTDGKLIQATIRRSSGHLEIDQAALGILRLASPFDAFPRSVALQDDEIHFAYEWQFLSGQTQGSSVLIADPAVAPANQ